VSTCNGVAVFHCELLYSYTLLCVDKIEISYKAAVRKCQIRMKLADDDM